MRRPARSWRISLARASVPVAAALVVAAVAWGGASALRAATPGETRPARPAAPAVTPDAAPRVRAQVDTVGFAVSEADQAAVVRAARAAWRREAAGRGGTADAAGGARSTPGGPWIAAILPHDDYLYAGPTYASAVDGLEARRWIVFGVCHACRRLGVRDQLLLDDYDAWRVAGREHPVDRGLRARLLAALGEDARVDDERHAAEHSLEALLPWIQAGGDPVPFVPILVPGMSWERMQDVADRLAAALAAICREEGWEPGRDLGILISADAVHYGCEDWGPTGGYQEFGCDEAAHAAARAQDLDLARTTLAGPLLDRKLERFTERVWDETNPGYPYKITWCGLYSIPCGLAVARRLEERLGLPPLEGRLLRYGDSATDGRLDVEGTGLGVTAPAHVRHWVGYAALGYAPAAGE